MRVSPPGASIAAGLMIYHDSISESIYTDCAEKAAWSGCFINLNLVIKVVITHRKRCCAHDQTGAAGARMISFNG